MLSRCEVFQALAVRTDCEFPLIIIHGGNPLVIVSIQHMNNMFISSLIFGADLKV